MSHSETATETPSTRERLRDAALELFGEKGYDGTSMSELADRVGIAKPSLYNYYRSKEELLIDLLDEGIRRWGEVCMQPFDEPWSFERQLAEHLRRVVEFARQHPHSVALFHLATSHVQGELAERVGTLVAEREGELRRRFAERIDEARAGGELDVAASVDAELFLGIFFHGLLFLQATSQHDAGPVEQHLDAIWRQLFRGLSGREPKESPSS